MKDNFLKNNLNLNETIAKDLFKNVCYPWEVLPNISQFIRALGNLLPKDKFDLVDDGIFIAKNAKVAKSACLMGPTIIDEYAEVRHCAFIRGSVIVGKNAVIGNSTELKNSIIFNSVQIPHYNYVGDSILGYKSHMGAGSITSNVKSDKSLIEVNFDGTKLKTGLKKFGAVVSDYVEIGCNSVLNPGTIIGKNTSVYPLSSVRGFVGENLIYKSRDNIIKKLSI